MRINLYVATATGLSRRAADKLVADGKVSINQRTAHIGDQVSNSDEINLGAKRLTLPLQPQTIMLNKPVGYVCSRDGQGSKTIYDLLPPAMHKLKPVGRLDKDSSGLLLLTNDGQLANRLTHPSFGKTKIYEIELDKVLSIDDQKQIEKGVRLDDGPSALALTGKGNKWFVTMSEGRNRQIRRSFETLGYKVTKLHRIQFGDYKIGSVTEGKYLLTK